MFADWVILGMHRGDGDDLYPSYVMWWDGVALKIPLIALTAMILVISVRSREPI